MMPVFKQTLNDKKQFLSDIEIDELESVISEYKQIQSFIYRRILMSPMYYDALNGFNTAFTVYAKLRNIEKGN